MKKNVIRSSVYIGVNSYGAVYEATGDPEKYIVNLCQRESWYNRGNLYEITKTVPWTTENTNHKRGHVLPGNIMMGLSSVPILEDEPEEYLYLLEDGSVAHDAEGNCIWCYWYYDSQSPHSPTGLIPGEDNIDEWMGINYEWEEDE